MIEPQPPSPADLQGRMRQVRHDLDSHSEEMARQVRSQLDWRNLVAKHPLFALGTAAAAGYLLAPRRMHCQCVDDKIIKETVEQAMDRAQQPAASAAKASGLAAGLASMVMAMVVREGLSFASHWVRNFFDSQAEGPDWSLNASNQSAAANGNKRPHVTTNGDHL
jgi:hypothetical protein